jgi:hypothetical protein
MIRYHRYLPPLINLAPVTSSTPDSCFTLPDATFLDTGASPQPQSYVASKCAQSNWDFFKRSLTLLCTEQSLGEDQLVAAVLVWDL